MVGPGLTRAAKRALSAAGVAVASLHVLWALTTPVGENNDDAVYLLLARALRHGAYMLPDGLGLPATYPPPGYPLLLAPLTWLLEPRWDALRFLGLAFSALLVVLTWRLARRILGERGAAAAALLVALNNVFMLYSGVVMPDIAYAACSLAIFSAFSEANEDLRRPAALAAAAGLTALLRPHGVILIASLGLALWVRRGLRRGLLFSLPALLPSALWAARNYAVARTSSGYMSYWATMWSQLDLRAQLVHCSRVAATYFGEGLLGLVGLPFWFLLAAAAAAAALIVHGAIRALKGRSDAGVLASVIYLACMVFVQMAWRIEVVRYLLPILPICWIFLLKAVADLSGRRRWPAVCFVLLAAAAAVRLDVAFLRGRRLEAVWRPATMAWIGDNVPVGTRVLSYREGAVMLLARRPALPMFDGLPRDRWPVAARHYQVGYVLLESAATMRKLEWLSRSPGVQEVYRNRDEETLVLKL